METDVPCPKCGEETEANLYLRDSKRGLWLSCSRFPKCRGRVGFNKLDEEKQAELEKAWKQHEADNPTPEIITTSGHVITEEETYLPEVAGEEPAGSLAPPDADAA